MESVSKLKIVKKKKIRQEPKRYSVIYLDKLSIPYHSNFPLTLNHYMQLYFHIFDTALIHKSVCQTLIMLNKAQYKFPLQVLTKSEDIYKEQNKSMYNSNTSCLLLCLTGM